MRRRHMKTRTDFISSARIRRARGSSILEWDSHRLGREIGYFGGVCRNGRFTEWFLVHAAVPVPPKRRSADLSPGYSSALPLQGLLSNRPVGGMPRLS
jgi:hypothetical protein